MHRTGRRAIAVLLLAALVVMGGGSLAFARADGASVTENGSVSGRVLRRIDESVLAVAPTTRSVVADASDPRLAKRALRLLMGAALLALVAIGLRRRRPAPDATLHLADPPWSFAELTRGPPAADLLAA